MWSDTIAQIAACAGLAACATAQPTELWTFDNDFSSSGANGTAGSAVGDGISITNSEGDFIRGTGALRIDHSTESADYVDIPTAVFPEFLTNDDNPVSWTVSVWFKFDPSLGPDDDRNFLFETAPDDAVGIGPDTSGDVDEAEWFIGGVANNNGNGPVVEPNVWNHLALAYDKANSDLIVFYLNGEVIDVRAIGLGQFFSDGPDEPLDPSVGNDSQDDGLHIGNHRNGDGARNWQGFIDNFAIFDVALGPTQIDALFEGEFMGNPVDPFNVVDEVPADIELLIPEFEPDIEESGWTLEETIPFRGPAGLDFDDATGTLYVGRRFQGDERSDDPANPTETGLDGLYSIDASGMVTQLAGGDNVAGVTIGPDGAIYFAEDFDGVSGDGEILRYDPVTDTTTTNATGFADGDSDPMNLDFVPDGFELDFGPDSLGDPFVEPGDAICVDRGNGGFEEVYVWDPINNPDAPLVGAEQDGEALVPNFDEILVIDGQEEDGDGESSDPDTNNNPFDNTADVVITTDAIYIADEGKDIIGGIWRVVGIDTVERIALSEDINPIALELDPASGDLLAIDRSLAAGETRVVRIDPDSGSVSDVVTNLGGFPGDGGNAGWGSLTVSADGDTLWGSLNNPGATPASVVAYSRTA